MDIYVTGFFCAVTKTKYNPSWTDHVNSLKRQDFSNINILNTIMICINILLWAKQLPPIVKKGGQIQTY